MAGWFDIPNGLRDALLADAGLVGLVEDRVHYQMMPQHSTFPHVWFSRTGRRQDSLLDGSEEMSIETFSIEIVGVDNCDAVVDRVVEVLESFDGPMESRRVQYVEITDADDNYIFKSVGEGDPDYLHALQIEIYSTKEA